MSEERISHLSELYDRTRRCTGITIPKSSLVVVSLDRDDIPKFMNMHMTALLHMLSNTVGVITSELLTAGVEDLYVVFERLPERNEEDIGSAIENRINNFRDSHRPNARIHYKYYNFHTDDLESQHWHLGEYDSAVIIHGREREIIHQDELSFVSKKTVAVFVTEDSSGDEILLCGDILAFDNSHGDNPKEMSYTPDEGEKADRFRMNYRVATQAIYMLCSDELADCFQEIPKQFKALETDANFVKDIFDKFQRQGITEKSGTIEFFKDLIRGGDYFPNLHESPNLYNREKDSSPLEVSPENWFEQWMESNEREWFSSEVAELLKRERQLANTEPPAPEVVDELNDETPAEADMEAMPVAEDAGEFNDGAGEG